MIQLHVICNILNNVISFCKQTRGAKTDILTCDCKRKTEKNKEQMFCYSYNQFLTSPQGGGGVL